MTLKAAQTDELPAWTRESGRVALVHDWLTGMRGGEAILDVMCELFPEAPLYTLLQTDYKMSPRILNGRQVHTSYLQKFMGIEKFRKEYRKLLPLFPHAVSTLDLSGYDLIVSHTHCVAKGVRKDKDATHVSYVSTPMRYIWDMYDEYFGPGKADPVVRALMALVRKPLQRWDVQSTDRVNHLIANSSFVQQRIRQTWDRESAVIHPFVDLERFHFDPQVKPADYYLIVSAFAPYKRIDLAVRAFRQLNLPLKIVGRGQEEANLRRMGGGNIEFLGGLSNEAVTELYRRSKALVFPGLEDFGITPLEAMACGRPVIGYGKGGLLDTVTPETGILFPEQTEESLIAAVRKFESGEVVIDPAKCRARAEAFGRDQFRRRLQNFIVERLPQ